MPIENTDKDIFDKQTAHLSHYRKMASVVSIEKEYLTTSNKNKLAVILEGKNGKFFGYVLLKKDAKDKFELEEANVKFKSFDAAKTALHNKMST
jgi:hypothetical protein